MCTSLSEKSWVKSLLWALKMQSIWVECWPTTRLLLVKVTTVMPQKESVLSNYVCFEWNFQYFKMFLIWILLLLIASIITAPEIFLFYFCIALLACKEILLWQNLAKKLLLFNCFCFCFRPAPATVLFP